MYFVSTQYHYCRRVISTLVILSASIFILHACIDDLTIYITILQDTEFKREFTEIYKYIKFLSDRYNKNQVVSSEIICTFLKIWDRFYNKYIKNPPPDFKNTIFWEIKLKQLQQKRNNIQKENFHPFIEEIANTFYFLFKNRKTSIYHAISTYLNTLENENNIDFKLISKILKKFKDSDFKIRMETILQKYKEGSINFRKLKKLIHQEESRFLLKIWFINKTE